MPHGVVDHLWKMNFHALVFSALPKRRIGVETSLVMIGGVNLCVSHEITLFTQTLRSCAVFRCIRHNAAFGPSRSEKLRQFQWYLNQSIEIRNLAIIGKRPEDAFRLRVVEHRSEWLALCLC